MATETQIETPVRRSFFRSPLFWIGCVSWIGVGALLINRRLDSTKPSNTDQPAAVSDPASESTSKRVILKSNPDGSVTLVPGEAQPSESPWDPDGVGDFAFTDTEGKTITKQDLLGKPWIVCFVFTHCAWTCPTVTTSMRHLQDELKDVDFHLVTLTVDPERDTPEILKQYGKDRGADFSKWSFLGGDQREIYRLIHDSFKMPVKEMFGTDRKPGFEFLHSNNIMLVDQKGVVRAKFDATSGPAMSKLRREIRELASTANESKEDAKSETPGE